MSRFRILIFLCLIFHPQESLAKTQRIHVMVNESDLDVRHDFEHRMMHLLLSKTTKEYGPYELVPTPRMNQTRAFDELKSGKTLDIVAGVFTRERVRDFLAIKHSFHKDLMGTRLLLIRKEREQDFAKVKTLEDLKKLVAIQGADFPDVAILERNDLPVITGRDYEGLFRMLTAGRGDYFPRGLVEIHAELKAHPNQNLVIEKTLALSYFLPAYFYVNKNNKALAERLEKGWQIALADGSFEAAFQEQDGEAIKSADLKNRRIFYLNNPE